VGKTRIKKKNYFLKQKFQSFAQGVRILYTGLSTVFQKKSQQKQVIHSFHSFITIILIYLYENYKSPKKSALKPLCVFTYRTEKHEPTDFE